MSFTTSSTREPHLRSSSGYCSQVEESSFLTPRSASPVGSYTGYFTMSRWPGLKKSNGKLRLILILGDQNITRPRETLKESSSQQCIRMNYQTGKLLPGINTQHFPMFYLVDTANLNCIHRNIIPGFCPLKKSWIIFQDFSAQD